MTHLEYWSEVSELAEYFNEENGDWTKDYSEYVAHDDRYAAMHEVIDGHRYIIYYSEAEDVLRYTDNEDAYFSEFGCLPPGETLDEIRPPMAYMAMMADINNWTGETV